MASKSPTLPHKTITVYNEYIKASQTFSGVPLIDQLVPLGVPLKPQPSSGFLLGRTDK
jgi:hypothetical protein